MDLAVDVEKTIAYGNYFNFPLSADEVHFWLISPHLVSKEDINILLPTLTPKEISLRKKLQKNASQKEKTAFELIKYARFFPGIRLIALTGSVAANNSKMTDDLDLLIITSAHSLWLIRPLLLLLLSLKFNRRHPGDSPSQTQNTFCPNLWLDTLSLSVPINRQNIYTAHEVLQIKPLFDRGDTYQQFIQSNSWTKHYLANAYSIASVSNNKHLVIPAKAGIYSNRSPIRSGMTAILSIINYLFFLLQYLYMLPKITTEEVSPHAAYFHKKNPSASLEKHLNNNSL